MDQIRPGDLVDLNSPACVPPPLVPGDPLPWLRMRSDVRADFRVATVGGRYVALSFLDGFATPVGASAHHAFLDAARGLSPAGSALLLVSRDPRDTDRRVPPDLHAVRYLFDDGRAAALLGVGDDVPCTTFVADPQLRVVEVVRESEPRRHVDIVSDVLRRLPPLPAPRDASLQAPVLVVPGVFAPDVCAALISGYEAHGGTDSGVMVERDGMTTLQVDHRLKRRRDWVVSDAALVRRCHVAIQRRLLSEIERAFQFRVTRIERNLVACYDAASLGGFDRHRDNTTRGTAHRRFAVSINLNTEDHEGGELVFPEFGTARFRPPTGGACVFSCSLMHEALPVTKGRRFVFVPFLYDEEAHRIREANLRYVQTAPDLR